VAVPSAYRLNKIKKRVPAQTFHVPQIVQMGSWLKEKEKWG